MRKVEPASTRTGTGIVVKKLPLTLIVRRIHNYFDNDRAICFLLLASLSFFFFLRIKKRIQHLQIIPQISANLLNSSRHNNTKRLLPTKKMARVSDLGECPFQRTLQFTLLSTHNSYNKLHFCLVLLLLK